MSKPTHRPSFFRRRYLINTRFQYNFMFQVTGIVLFSMAVIYSSNYFFFKNFLEKGEKLNLPTNHPFFLLLREQQEFLGHVFLVSCVIISLAVGLWGLLYSHRIAGPLYRLRKEFLKAASERKSLDQINFRKGDFFQEIPNSINLYFHREKQEVPPPFQEEKKKAS